jgi:hypothetical protein
MSVLLVLRTEATSQARHDARAGQAHELLNGSCLRPARHTQPIWLSIPPHDNDGPRLSCRHLVRHPASSLSLHASVSAPPHSRQRAWEQAPPPRIRPTPASTPTRAVTIARPRGHFTVCAHHRFRHRWASRSSSRPSPVLSRQPTAPTHGRSHEPTDAL